MNESACIKLCYIFCTANTHIIIVVVIVIVVVAIKQCYIFKQYCQHCITLHCTVLVYSMSMSTQQLNYVVCCNIMKHIQHNIYIMSNNGFLLLYSFRRSKIKETRDLKGLEKLKNDKNIDLNFNPCYELLLNKF